ncbi:MAG: hypothetical protein K8S54_04095 [Spirochaetia bacterium]|nr:hypothetical protein [Spirochaetia bacterium]
MQTIRIVCLIAMWVSSSAIWAQPDMRGPGPGMMGPPGGPPLEVLTRELSLTKDQQEKTRALREKNQPILRAQMDKLPALHDELRKILEVEKVDISRVRQQLHKIDDVLIEIRIIEIQERLAFETLLTKEQLAAFKELHRKRGERRPRMNRPEGEP